MVHAELSVITYVPLEHSMSHWAIYLCIVNGDEIQNFIYQANNDEERLELSIREVDPKASRHFCKEISISDIDNESATAEVKKTIEQQLMQNDTTSWNCQDWVMKTLETLNDDMLLDEYQYLEAKQTLDELYHD